MPGALILRLGEDPQHNLQRLIVLFTALKRVVLKVRVAAKSGAQDFQEAVPEHHLKAADILDANVAQLGVAFMKAENVFVGRAGQDEFAGLRVIAAAEEIDLQTLVADLLNLASGDFRPGDLQTSVPKMGDAFSSCGMGSIVRIWLH